MNSSLVEWPSCSLPCSQHSCDKSFSLLSPLPPRPVFWMSATRHSHHWALENSLWKRKIGKPQAPNYSDLQSLPSRFNAWPLQAFPFEGLFKLLQWLLSVTSMPGAHWHGAPCGAVIGCQYHSQGLGCSCHFQVRLPLWRDKIFNISKIYQALNEANSRTR